MPRPRSIAPPAANGSLAATDSSAEICSSAPKGRKTIAQGNALGSRHPTNLSPEGAWPFVAIHEITRHHSGNSKLIKGKLFDSPGPGRFAGFSASGQDVWLDSFDREGDAIIVSAVGARCGKCFIARGKWSAVANTHVVWPDEEKVDLKYLWYLLNNEDFWVRSGSAQPFVATRKTFEKEIPLPPLPEQRRIVARIEELFSRLDAGVAALRHAKAQLQRYRQSVLAAAVTGQLTQAWREQHPDTEPAEELLKRILKQRREQWNGKGKYRDALEPDNPSELPEIPANWIWTTLDSLCISKVGNAFKSAQFKDAGVRLLRGENIEPGALRWSNTRYWPESNIAEFQDLLVDQGDVIIAMDRPLISSGLKVAVAKKEDTPCLLVQRVTRLRPIDPITSTFIFTNINTKRFVDQLIGNQTGTQIPHITEKGIRCFAIPLPPLPEQHHIVAEVEARTTAIDHLAAELDRQISRSNRLRQSTLRSAFSGNL